MRRWRYDDFLHDDVRQECIHGYTKYCLECDAEGERYWQKERWERIAERAMWAAIGFLACIVIYATQAVLL